MLQRLRSARAGVAKEPATRPNARKRAPAPTSVRASGKTLAAKPDRPKPGRARQIRAASPRLRRPMLADEENSAIIDVGSRGSGNDEVAQGLEEARRIVLGEKRRRIKTLPDRPMQA